MQLGHFILQYRVELKIPLHRLWKINVRKCKPSGSETSFLGTTQASEDKTWLKPLSSKPQNNIFEQIHQFQRNT